MNELAELIYHLTSTHASLDAIALKLILNQLHHLSNLELQAILALLDSAVTVEQLSRVQDLIQTIGPDTTWHCFPPNPCPV